MCGVKTNIITAVEIHGRNTGDAPLLPALVNATARNFKISEVSADKGYSSRSNLEAVERIGAEPFVAFKANTRGNYWGGIWDKTFHYFQFKRGEFLQHYHKRSNVEATFSMMKRKFRRRLAEQNRCDDGQRGAL